MEQPSLKSASRLDRWEYPNNTEARACPLGEKCGIHRRAEQATQAYTQGGTKHHPFRDK